MSNHRNTWKQLRKLGIFAGSDAFMQGGHQIINSNRAYAGPARKNAEWAKSDKKVCELLLRVFPKMTDNKCQRERAGKWLRVIQLYYRSVFYYGDTAIEMNEKKSFVNNVLNRIRKALQGRPCDGRDKPRKIKEARTPLGAQ